MSLRVTSEGAKSRWMQSYLKVAIAILKVTGARASCHCHTQGRPFLTRSSPDLLPGVRRTQRSGGNRPVRRQLRSSGWCAAAYRSPVTGDDRVRLNGKRRSERQGRRWGIDKGAGIRYATWFTGGGAATMAEDFFGGHGGRLWWGRDEGGGGLESGARGSHNSRQMTSIRSESRLVYQINSTEFTNDFHIRFLAAKQVGT